MALSSFALQYSMHHENRAISDKLAVSARNCLAFTLNLAFVMKMKKLKIHSGNQQRLFCLTVSAPVCY